MVLRFACIALAFCSLFACATVPASQVTDLKEVPQEMTVLVGKIEMHPPLQPAEQHLSTDRGEELKNSFVLYCGDAAQDFKKNKPVGFEGSFLVTLEQEFFIKVNKDRTVYIPGGSFYTVYEPPFQVELVTLSSLFKVELRPDDEAVYIGTIQYYRDDRNELQSVTIRDDYQWADAEFKERFGMDKTLRKALLTPASSK